MKPELPLVLKILQEACEKYGFSWQMIDDYSNCLAEISKEGRSFFASNRMLGVYPTNSRFAAQLVNDKAWTYEVLKKKGFKIPKGDYFFLRPEYREMRGDGKEIEDALQFVESIGYPVFVKPNSKSIGRYADVAYDEDQLLERLGDVETVDHMALVQETIDAPEYRIFTVDGDIQFVYQRSPPQLVGDGNRTIKELLDEWNNSVDKDFNRVTEDSEYFQNKMNDLGVTLSTILESDRYIRILSRANISSGGTIMNYSESLSEDAAKWSRSISEAVSLRVCGIDIFAEDLSNPDTYTVIELNQNPSLRGIYEAGRQERALQIWNTILKSYFS